MRKRHYERRGSIDLKMIRIYFKRISKAIHQYRPESVLNMDETFVKTFNMMYKVIGFKNVETINIDSGNKYNEKEGVAFVAIVPFRMHERFHLFAIEKKYYLQDYNDGTIMHSQNGWMNNELMTKYLDCLSRTIGPEKMALVLDVYKAHINEEVKEFAKSKNIDLIFVV